MASDGRTVVLPHHAAIVSERQRQNLSLFLAAPEGAAGDSARSGRRLPGQQLQQQQLVLVCTDRASRGLDSAYCEHVVLFDFPRDPSEYVRRVGRTARGGGAGLVTVLALGRQVKLAKDIIKRCGGRGKHCRCGAGAAIRCADEMLCCNGSTCPHAFS